MARLGGEVRAREQRAFESYENAAGAVMRARTRPECLRGTTLFVRASSSAVAHELTLLRGEILAKMVAEVGPELVTELRTRVGPLRATGS
jgi:predicted nucleic acid-binding Zn ribbon protein